MIRTGSGVLKDNKSSSYLSQASEMITKRSGAANIYFL